FCRPRPPFFLVSPRPPISTLFPYTTLFRSVGRLVRVQVEGLSGRFETAVRSELEARLDLAFGDLEQERATVVAQRQRAAAPQRPQGVVEPFGADVAHAAEQAVAHAAFSFAAATVRSSARSDSWLRRRMAFASG